MDIKIVENKKEKLRFEVHGGDHALMNLLIKHLESDPDVIFSTYSVPHPLLEGFMVTVRGKDPQGSVKKALTAMRKDTGDLKKTLAKSA